MNKQRILAIGDIHGNLIGLRQVLDRARFNVANDLIIFLGDYVDGHPMSAEVVQEILSIPEENRICLLGNHDYWCRDFLVSGKREWMWTTQGGQATIESYIKNPEYMTGTEHREFFENLLPYYELEHEGQRYAFVHGGWLSEQGLGHDREEVYMWDRSLYSNMLTNGAISNARMEKYDAVFVGHTTTESTHLDLKPVTLGKLTNLDQGGGWTGKITIMDVVTRDYWQSDAGIYGNPSR